MSRRRAVGQENSLFPTGGQSFHSGQAFSCSNGAHRQEARRAAPLLISSSNTFPDTPAITFGQIPGHPVRGLSR